MKKDKIDIIVYGDFSGHELKYKAYGASQYIEVLKEMGLLGKVICRQASGRNNFISAIPFGSFTPKLLTFIQNKTGIGLRNFSQNMLFDYFASKKIESKNVISFVQGARKCLGVVKKNGGLYIEVSATENMEEYLATLIDESSKFNLSVKKDIRKILLNGIKTAKKADYLIVISRHAKDTYVKRGYNKDKIFVVEQGIDLKKINAKKKYSEKKFLKISCIAHFQILKGLHYLVQAVKELNNPNITLNVIGDMDKNSKMAIKNLSGNLKSFSKINYLGINSNPGKFLANSDIFVSSSLSEGFGRSIAEAMIVGVPVIITDRCGVNIKNNTDGFIINAKNVNQLKSKINFFLENKSELEKMGKNARDQIMEICSVSKRKRKIILTINDILKI